MPTETRSKTLYANIKIWKSHNYQNGVYAYGPLTYAADWGIDYDSRTYVQARRRPKGFVNPKPYTRHIKFGATTAHYPYSSYWYLKNGTFPKGVDSYEYGPDDTSFRAMSVLSFDSSLANKAIVGARLKLKDEKVNLALAIGESTKTAKTILSSAKKVASSFNHLKHGRFKRAAAALGVTNPFSGKKRKPKSDQDLHNSWLELQYGWKPLLQDIHGAADSMAKNQLADPSQHFCTVTATRSLRDLYQDVVIVSDAIGNGVSLARKRDTQFGCFIRLDYVQSNPYLSDLASQGFTNPASLAWEALPYSFVVDWFAPVGNYLSQLDAEVGWDFLAGSLTTRQLTKMVYSPSIHSTGNHTSEYVSAAQSLYTEKKVVRTVYSSSPSGSCNVKNPFSGLHVANAVALLKAAFNR